jgi:formylglycine-generating enzyme required for sulfatase activity
LRRIDAVLDEGEEILFEGWARGRPPLLVAALVYGFLLALPVFVCTVFMYSSYRQCRDVPHTWDVTWTHIVLTVPHPKPGGFSRAVSAGPLAGFHSPFLPDVEIPAIFCFAVFVGLAEVVRLARWRSRGYAITTRRLLTCRGLVLPRVRAHARTGRESVVETRAGPRIEGLASGSVVLRGLDAPLDTIRGALARFDPTPASRIPWFWTWRRDAAIFVASVLLVVGALYGAFHLKADPSRLTLRATRTSQVGVETVKLELDSPTDGPRAFPPVVQRHLRPCVWRVLGDGVVLGGDSWHPPTGTGRPDLHSILRRIEKGTETVTGVATPPAVLRIEGTVDIDRDPAASRDPGEDREHAGETRVWFSIDLKPGETVEIDPERVSPWLPSGLRRAERTVPAAGGKAVDLSLFRLPDGSDMELVQVLPGDFRMGDFKGAPDEDPEHPHAMDHRYWIGRNDVTWAQYMAFCAATGRAEPKRPYWWDKVPGPKSDHPVTMVSWEDARAFCAWAKLALPTEEEWEKAARGEGFWSGDMRTEGKVYPWGKDWDPTRCNFADSSCPADTLHVGDGLASDWLAKRGGWDKAHSDGFPYTSPVGSFPAGVSWCGTLDMAGNVYQWCEDWYGPYQPVYDHAESPTGNQGAASFAPRATGTYRVARGGSWFQAAPDCRVSARGFGDPKHGNDMIGFRVLLRDP